MKRHPLKIMGIVFAAIALAEIVAALLIHLFGSADSASKFTLVTLFAGQAVIFGGLGICFLLWVRRREQRRERLMAAGYFEMATVVDLERSYAVRINSRHPWYVICRIERNGVLHEYRSDMLLCRPDVQTGDQVRVYLDRQNDNVYYVDVESTSPDIIRHG